MTDISSNRYSRTPYTVSYYKDGVKQTIRRTPPPKLHPVEPDDTVTIIRKKNADWDEGEEVTVRGINPRQPNVLRVENDKKQKTFLTYFDVKWNERKESDDIDVADKKAAQKDPIGSSYLLWP